jgi:hypothetical protein
LIDLIKSALASCLCSAAITGVGVYYLHLYLDSWHKESEARAARRQEERRKADVLESKRRHAAGRMFFWLHDAALNGVGHANGDLEKAWANYTATEDEQKAFEQELLAEHHDENRGGG